MYQNETAINGLKDRFDRTLPFHIKTNALVQPCPLDEWRPNNLKKHGYKRNSQAIRRILQPMFPK